MNGIGQLAADVIREIQPMFPCRAVFNKPSLLKDAQERQNPKWYATCLRLEYVKMGTGTPAFVFYFQYEDYVISHTDLAKLWFRLYQSQENVARQSKDPNAWVTISIQTKLGGGYLALDQIIPKAVRQFEPSAVHHWLDKVRNGSSDSQIQLRISQIDMLTGDGDTILYSLKHSNNVNLVSQVNSNGTSKRKQESKKRKKEEDNDSEATISEEEDNAETEVKKERKKRVIIRRTKGINGDIIRNKKGRQKKSKNDDPEEEDNDSDYKPTNRKLDTVQSTNNIGTITPNFAPANKVSTKSTNANDQFHSPNWLKQVSTIPVYPQQNVDHSSSFLDAGKLHRPPSLMPLINCDEQSSSPSHLAPSANHSFKNHPHLNQMEHLQSPPPDLSNFSVFMPNFAESLQPWTSEELTIGSLDILMGNRDLEDDYYYTDNNDYNNL